MFYFIFFWNSARFFGNCFQRTYNIWKYFLRIKIRQQNLNSYKLSTMKTHSIVKFNKADLSGHSREKLATWFLIKYAFFIQYFYGITAYASLEINSGQNIARVTFKDMFEICTVPRNLDYTVGWSTDWLTDRIVRLNCLYIFQGELIPLKAIANYKHFLTIE